MSDLIDRQAAIEALACLEDYEEQAIEALRKLPSAQTDLSEYSDRLWRNAYEHGKKEGQSEIVRCKDCKHRDPEDKKCDSGHFILWQLPREDDWFCADGERRNEDE